MWDKSVNEVLNYFKTSEKGLALEEVEKRLKENGKNEIPKFKKDTLLKIFLEQIKSPIVIILIIATVFSIITKSYADAGFIFIVIIINAIIGTYQEWSSEKSSEKLQNMIKINSKVLRNGEVQLIDSENIVVGDIIVLESRR